MRLKMLLAGAVLAAGALLPSAAQAGPPLHHRVVHQRVAIRHGVRNGSLTPWEATRLRHHERWDVRQLHHERRTGGHLTWREHRRTTVELNHQHRLIHRLETNRRHD